MHLLYVDESGNPADAAQPIYVLAGFSVFERQTHFLEQELDGIAGRFEQSTQSVELHGSPMHTGKSLWRRFPESERQLAIKDALSLVPKYRRKVRLFGAAVDTTAIFPRDPIEYSFEQLAMRFDRFLQRCYLNGNPQRGLMVFDESSKETRIQTLAREFKRRGHSFGKTRNLAEVPVFLDSRATRLIQLADLVTYAIFRNLVHGDAQYFDIISECFDTDACAQSGLKFSLGGEGMAKMAALGAITPCHSLSNSS